MKLLKWTAQLVHLHSANYKTRQDLSFSDSNTFASIPMVLPCIRIPFHMCVCVPLLFQYLRPIEQVIPELLSN